MRNSDYYLPAIALGVAFVVKLPALRRGWRDPLVRSAHFLIFTAGILLAGIAVIPWLSSARFARLALHHKAARTMGASAWRIFWRITLPCAWPQILIGILLAAASAALLAWTAA